MSETANNIVQWLYSNDVALIKKAFKVYTPHLEGAVKKAFEQRSDDLKDIGFSDLACNTIYLDGFFIRDDLSRIVEPKNKFSCKLCTVFKELQHPRPQIMFSITILLHWGCMVRK